LPEPDLTTTERREIALQGGMMSGMGTMGRGSMMGGMGMMGRGGATWAMDGMSMTGDGQPDMPPLVTLKRGQSCVLALRNETAWWHPMHLHGHSFRVISRNSKPTHVGSGGTRCSSLHARSPKSLSSPTTPVTGCFIATLPITRWPA